MKLKISFFKNDIFITRHPTTLNPHIVILVFVMPMVSPSSRPFTFTKILQTNSIRICYAAFLISDSIIKALANIASLRAIRHVEILEQRLKAVA